MHAGVVGGVEDEGAGRRWSFALERAQRHRPRLVGAEQDGHVGPLPLQRLGGPVAELAALDHRAVIRMFSMNTVSPNL